MAANKAPEEEDCETGGDGELDLNSAFVATALRKMSTGEGTRSKVVSAGVVLKTAPPENLHSRSRTLAHEGCEMWKLSRCADAVELFTYAMKPCGTERSYDVNRLICYTILDKFSKALKDADMSVPLEPQSAKGYFRRGKALLGLQGYNEASEAFSTVLKLEPNNPDAKKELHKVHIYELKNMKLRHVQAEWVLEQGAVDVPTAVNMLGGGNAIAPDFKENPGNLQGFRSLCMGSRAPDVTEKICSLPCSDALTSSFTPSSASCGGPLAATSWKTATTNTFLVTIKGIDSSPRGSGKKFN
ncbi:uncharacterized protein LOC144139147 [Haemaphysalis longicornis]